MYKVTEEELTSIGDAGETEWLNLQFLVFNSDILLNFRVFTCDDAVVSTREFNINTVF